MKLCSLAKALSEEPRVRLMAALLRHELSVNELGVALGLPQSTVSRHLKALASAGLAVSRRDGQWVFYRSAADGPARAYLDACAPLLAAEPQIEADAGAVERVVADRAQESARFFNAIAPDWERLRRETLAGFDPGPEMERRMPFSGAVADLGCGAGALAPWLLTRSGLYIGVDNSPQMLDLARRAYPDPARCSWRLGELERLPLADREVQAAALCLALHHAAEPRAALAEARRILAPGGTLLLLDFTPHQREAMRRASGDRWLGFDPDALSEWLLDAGLPPRTRTLFPLGNGLTLVLFEARRP
jgi:DNA-binding transcriptional ArsR family regulator